jgi:tetratricopeptide (TPR) repeat protein
MHRRSFSNRFFGSLLLASVATFLWAAPRLLLAQQALTDNQRAALAKLSEGVQAYKDAQFDEAIEDFKRAAELDHSLLNAKLYLATAYASQYVPGGQSEENLEYGTQSLREYHDVLEQGCCRMVPGLAV